MSASFVLMLGKGATSGLLRYFKARLDPDKRRALDEQMMSYALAEFPRLFQLIEERGAQIAASTCTHEEAFIIAHQVFESMMRTLDHEKRRRLANVLMNGLCAPTWDKVKLRLLIRLTAELEEEHIEVLRFEVRTPEERQRDEGARTREPRVGLSMKAVTERLTIATALDRELITRGLLNEDTKPKVKLQSRRSTDDRPAVESVELKTSVSISQLGRDLLAFIRDPTPLSGDVETPA